MNVKEVTARRTAPLSTPTVSVGPSVAGCAWWG